MPLFICVADECGFYSKEWNALTPSVIIFSLFGETNCSSYNPHMMNNLVEKLVVKISED